MSEQPADDMRTLGKKVFFLYPHSVIQNEMLTELIKNEYEIYLLKDHVKAVAIFRNYPDSIVLINIDEVLKEAEWEQYIGKLIESPEFANLKIGVLTYNNDPTLSKRYLMDLMVPCGFIKLSLKLTESTSIILRVLEANEAKGRRRFLRVACPNGAAKFNLREKGKTYSGIVLDISSVGMAWSFTEYRGFPARTVLSDIQLRLKTTLCSVSAIVMGSRVEDRGQVYILLFDKLSTVSRAKIREYIQAALQSNIEDEMRQVPSEPRR